MGLIKAALGSAGGVMADQWKEYFYCEAIPATVLAVKGRKRASGRSSNTKGSDNIITSGSVIAVADGQCMMIVEQGKVVEVCAEPGEFTFDASTEPSIFSGDLGESIGQVFQNIGKRFTFGGEAPKEGVLLQHQGDHRQQVRYTLPGSFPGGGPAGRDRHRHCYPLFRGVFLPGGKSPAVLYQCLRQCGSGF